MTRYAFLGLLSALLLSLCIPPSTAFARTASSVTAEENLSPQTMDKVAMLEGETALSAMDMDSLRGGFSLPNGLIYNFAIDVRSNLDGSTVYTHSLTLTPSSLSGAPFQASLATALIPQNLPSGLTMSLINNGVLISDAAGGSAKLLGQTSAGAPASIVLNTVSGLNISQTVNAVLTLNSLPTITNFVNTTTQNAAMAQHGAMRSLGF